MRFPAPGFPKDNLKINRLFILSLISSLIDDEGNFHFIGDISGQGRSGSKIFLDVVKPYEERADMRFFIMNHFFSHQITSTQVDQWDDPKSSGSLNVYYKNHWIYSILFFLFFSQADFVRVAHPKRDFAGAAEEACMNVSALVER